MLIKSQCLPSESPFNVRNGWRYSGRVCGEERTEGEISENPIRGSRREGVGKQVEGNQGHWGNLETRGLFSKIKIFQCLMSKRIQVKWKCMTAEWTYTIGKEEDFHQWKDIWGNNCLVLSERRQVKGCALREYWKWQESACVRFRDIRKLYCSLVLKASLPLSLSLPLPLPFLLLLSLSLFLLLFSVWPG